MAMVNRGGSFAAALGNAALHADCCNLAKIKAAFAEIWKSYERTKSGTVEHAVEAVTEEPF